MLFGKVLLSIAAVLSVFTAVDAKLQCQTDPIVKEDVPTDILFLIDNSNRKSTDNKIHQVLSGVEKFIRDSVWKGDLKPRMAIATFAGKPTIIAPFIDESYVRPNGGGQGNLYPWPIIHTMQQIQLKGNEREPSFEAMRMAVTNNGADMAKECDPSIFGDSCSLNWNPNSVKVIIHITDEDSDLPSNPLYQQPGQQEASFCANFYRVVDGATICADPDGPKYEPRFENAVLTYFKTIGKKTHLYQVNREKAGLSLHSTYEKEIEITAKALLDAGVFVNSLVSTRVGTSDDDFDHLPISTFDDRSDFWLTRKSADPQLGSDSNTVAMYQFGSPKAAEQSPNFQQFDAAKTLSKLQGMGLGNSLQARMLGANGFMRVFDVDKFERPVGDSRGNSMVDAFFAHVASVAYDLNNRCTQGDLPQPSSSAAATSSSSSAAASSTHSSSVYVTPFVTPAASSTHSSSVYVTPFVTPAISSSSVEAPSTHSSSVYVTPFVTPAISSSSGEAPSTHSTSVYDTPFATPAISSSSVEAPSTHSTSVYVTPFATPAVTTSVAGDGSVHTTVYGEPHVSTVHGQESVVTSSTADDGSVHYTTVYGGEPVVTSIVDQPAETSIVDLPAETTVIHEPAVTSSSAAPVHETTLTVHKITTTAVVDHVTPTPTAHDDQPVVTSTPIVNVPASSTTQPASEPSPVASSASPSPSVEEPEEDLDLDIERPPEIQDEEPNTFEEDAFDNFVLNDFHEPKPSATAVPTSAAGQSDNNNRVTDTPANVATMAILVPAAAASAIFGLLMLRRSRNVVRDFKYAFENADSTTAENPLYKASTVTHENPLFLENNASNIV